MRWIKFCSAVLAAMSVANLAQAGSCCTLTQSCGAAKSTGCATTCAPACCKPVIVRPCCPTVHTYQRRCSDIKPPCCDSCCHNGGCGPVGWKRNSCGPANGGCAPGCAAPAANCVGAGGCAPAAAPACAAPACAPAAAPACAAPACAPAACAPAAAPAACAPSLCTCCSRLCGSCLCSCCCSGLCRSSMCSQQPLVHQPLRLVLQRVQTVRLQRQAVVLPRAVLLFQAAVRSPASAVVC